MKKWISLILAALMLLAVAPAALADVEITEDSIVTIVNCKNSANVREEASSDSKKLGEAKRGNTYKLLAVKGNWYKVQYTEKQTGFVFHKYVKVGKKSDSSVGKTATVVNAPNGVNIRQKPNGKILGEAHNGDTFEVRGKSGNWTKVTYEGGVAYIFTAYLSISGSVTPPVAPGEKGYINCRTHVNVRAKASSASKKLGTLNRGAEISVTGINGNWTQIKYKNGTAYVFTKYVSATKPDDNVAGKTATIVNCKVRVNVRARASSSSDLLGTADKGSTWTVKGLSGNWVKVDYDGRTGFIYKRFVKIG